MANKTRAKVRPDLLIWARESAGLSLEEAAAKVKVRTAALAEWERGESSPSVPQLRNLAEAYKRPLAVLYLAEPPMKFQALKDFRRLPGGAMPKMTAEIVLEARLAHERRASVLNLAEEAGIQFADFKLSATLSENPEVVGTRIRNTLGVQLPLPGAYRDTDGRGGLRLWRSAIERADVLVLQTSRFSADIASGFAIYERQLPVVVVSRKDGPPRRRLFSLLHEFAHLLLRASGVSDSKIDADITRVPEEQRVEVFCNAVAAAALIPADQFLALSALSNHATGAEWRDEELDAIGRDFGVSKEAVLRRLLTFGRTTKAFYEETRDRYKREWQEQKDRQRSERSDEIKRNVPNETFHDLGRRFVTIVLDRFHHDRLTLSDVAGHLGVKTKHIPAIELMSRKSA